MSLLPASLGFAIVILAVAFGPSLTQAAGWANSATIATFGDLTTPIGSSAVIEDMFLIDDNNAIATHGANDIISTMTLNTFGVTTIAGQYGVGSDTDHATGTSGTINSPVGISKDTVNSRYIFASSGDCIRTLGLSSPYALGTLAGICGSSGETDGAFSGVSQFSNPKFIVPKTITSADQKIYTTDNVNDKVRWFTLNGQTVNTLFGVKASVSTLGGPYADARMRGPVAMGQSTSDTTSLYIHDFTGKQTLHVNLVSEFVKIIAGNGLENLVAGTPTAALSAGWKTFTNLLLLDKCRILTDFFSQDYLVLYDLTTNSVATVAGVSGGNDPPADGTGASASFSTTTDNTPVAVDSTGKVWIADHPYVRTATLPTTSDQNLLPGGAYRGPCLTATATLYSAVMAKTKTKTLAQRTRTATVVVPATKTKTLAVKRTSTKTVVVPRTSTKTVVVPRTSTKTVVVPRTSTKTVVVPRTSTKTIVVPTKTKTVVVRTATKTLMPPTPQPPTPVPPTPQPPTPVPPTPQPPTPVPPTPQPPTPVPPTPQPPTPVPPTPQPPSPAPATPAPSSTTTTTAPTTAAADATATDAPTSLTTSTTSAAPEANTTAENATTMATTTTEAPFFNVTNTTETPLLLESTTTLAPLTPTPAPTVSICSLNLMPYYIEWVSQTCVGINASSLTKEECAAAERSLAFGAQLSFWWAMRSEAAGGWIAADEATSTLGFLQSSLGPANNAIVKFVPVGSFWSILQHDSQAWLSFPNGSASIPLVANRPTDGSADLRAINNADGSTSFQTRLDGRYLSVTASGESMELTATYTSRADFFMFIADDPATPKTQCLRAVLNVRGFADLSCITDPAVTAVAAEVGQTCSISSRAASLATSALLLFAAAVLFV